MSERQKGVVKWFNSEKGFGYIGPDDGSEQLFVHYSVIESSGFRTLEEGQHVTFVVVQGMKGPQTDKVRVEE